MDIKELCRHRTKVNPAFHLLAKNNKGEKEWDLVEREEGGELNRGFT